MVRRALGLCGQLLWRSTMRLVMKRSDTWPDQSRRHGCASRSAATAGLLVFMAAVICLGPIGCIIPLPSKTTRGQRYSSKVLAFLSEPGVSRADVLAEFGPPLYESEEIGTMVYDWEQTPQYLVPLPHVAHR